MITSFAKQREEEFVGFVMKKSEKELTQKLRSSNRQLEQTKARISKLDTIVQHLYEGNLDGKISDEQFKSISKSYNKEQAELTSKIESLKTFIFKG